VPPAVSSPIGAIELTSALDCAQTTKARRFTKRVKAGQNAAEPLSRTPFLLPAYAVSICRNPSIVGIRHQPLTTESGIPNLSKRHIRCCSLSELSLIE